MGLIIHDDVVYQRLDYKNTTAIVFFLFIVYIVLGSDIICITSYHR